MVIFHDFDQSAKRRSSVANAAFLLRMLCHDADELGVSEIAERLIIAKSAASVLASTLTEEEMLERNPESGKYRLGSAAFERGALAKRSFERRGA